MKMLIVKRESNEWNWMWDQLSKHPINENINEPTVALNELNGESWQYIGSFENKGEVIHEFRHRSHPLDNEKRYYKFKASETFSDSDIEKQLPVK